MNIFLVEDEHWALAELTEQFKAYENEHRIFAFASGDDALAAVDSVHPHLVLTDINMPGMDGLELIEQLYKLDPSIKSMIISVYDQFEYARQGMKFGVFDYLLKPVKKDSLLHAVDKAIAHIKSDSKRREEWIQGSIAQMLLTEEKAEHDLLTAIDGNAYCVALLVLENGTALKDWKHTCIGFHELKERFAAVCSPLHDMFRVDLDNRQRVILIPLDEATPFTGIAEQLSSLHRQLQQLPVPIHLGYAVKSGSRTLYETFTALKQHLDEQLTFGKPTMLTPGSLAQDADIGHVWEKVRVMEMHWKKGDIVKGQADLRRILEELEKKHVTKRQLRLFVSDLLFSLTYNLHGSKAGIASMADTRHEIRLWNRLTGYHSLFDWLNETILTIYGDHEPKDINPKELIPILIRHIHTHYQGSISLQQFASEHHVSMGYLSRMFKSQTGCTFSDYVTAHRVGKAKELLADGVERLQDVSSLVGYEDLKHFSALFKKIVGETPISYARRVIKEKLPPSTGTNRKCSNEDGVLTMKVKYEKCDPVQDQ